MKVKIWLISWLVIVVSVLSVFGFWVYKIDPFFHYHKPDLDKYYYLLDNQRSQNDGIIKHFDYDALITGTSMTENFRVSEANKFFSRNFIKVAYNGGTYKEINDNIKNALEVNKNLKLVIRSLDMGKFLSPYDEMRTDMGEYPTYLYDKNPLNDVKYLLNRDVIFSRAYQMTLDNDIEDFDPGITNFDDYSRWPLYFVFGINSVAPDGVSIAETEQVHLTEQEKEVIKKNIDLNVTSVADAYRDVDFYYFYTPYSVVVWNDWRTDGSIYKMLEAEAYITELIIPHKNIHLFSFNNRTDITTDLNNYTDAPHYGWWINTLMLKWMHDGQYQLTKDNYKNYLKQEYDFYTTFDYSSINGQVDYEADFYAAALLNKELTGVNPIDVLNDDILNVSINGAEYITDDVGRNTVVNCYGTFARDNTDSLSDYIRDKEFLGIKFEINLDDGYNYFCFNGQKLMDNASLTAYVYDEDGTVVGQIEVNYPDSDNEVHQYVIDLSTISGKVTVVLNGYFVDYTGSPGSNYQFSDIYMY